MGVREYFTSATELNHGREQNQILAGEDHSRAREIKSLPSLLFARTRQSFLLLWGIDRKEVMKVRITAGREETGIWPEFYDVGDVVEVEPVSDSGRCVKTVNDGMSFGLISDWYEEVFEDAPLSH